MLSLFKSRSEGANPEGPLSKPRSPATDNPPIFIFDPDHLKMLGEKHAAEYQSAAPYPHIIIDDFLPLPIAEEILARFPDQNHPCWLDWRKRDVVHQPKKQGIGSAEQLKQVDPFIQEMLMAFNSAAFIKFLEVLTGVTGMLPDPHYFGGGLHQILPGGTLDLHVDFNYQPNLKLYRRTNILFYLNKDWKPEYNGYLELWDKDLKKCEKTVEPRFNRCMIFNTDEFSFHGHPKPLSCPENRTRKSMALYHYAVDPWPGQKTRTAPTWEDELKPETKKTS